MHNIYIYTYEILLNKRITFLDSQKRFTVFFPLVTFKIQDLCGSLRFHDDPNTL